MWRQPRHGFSFISFFMESTKASSSTRTHGWYFCVLRCWPRAWMASNFMVFLHSIQLAGPTRAYPAFSFVDFQGEHSHRTAYDVAGAIACCRRTRDLAVGVTCLQCGWGARDRICNFRPITPTRPRMNPPPRCRGGVHPATRYQRNRADRQTGRSRMGSELTRLARPKARRPITMCAIRLPSPGATLEGRNRMTLKIVKVILHLIGPPRLPRVGAGCSLPYVQVNPPALLVRIHESNPVPRVDLTGL